MLRSSLVIVSVTLLVTCAFITAEATSPTVKKSNVGDCPWNDCDDACRTAYIAAMNQCANGDEACTDAASAAESGCIMECDCQVCNTCPPSAFIAKKQMLGNLAPSVARNHSASLVGGTCLEDCEADYTECTTECQQEQCPYGQDECATCNAGCASNYNGCASSCAGFKVVEVAPIAVGDDPMCMNECNQAHDQCDTNCAAGGCSEGGCGECYDGCGQQWDQCEQRCTSTNKFSEFSVRRPISKLKQQ